MSQEEQDAILGKLVRELAESKRAVQAIELRMDEYALVLAGWSERLKAEANIAYTPQNPASEDQPIPSHNEVVKLIADCKRVRQRILNRKARLEEAG